MIPIAKEEVVVKGQLTRVLVVEVQSVMFAICKQAATPIASNDY